MKLCLKFGSASGDGAEGLKAAAAEPGFTLAEIGLPDARRTLSRGGSAASLLSAFQDAGLKCAVQLPLRMPLGFGSGMGDDGAGDLLELAALLCTKSGASALIVDPFIAGEDDPIMSDGMIRDDVRLSMTRVIAEHPYLRPCLRPGAAEGCSVRTLADARAVLESLNRHEAGIACDLSLLGEGAADDLKSMPEGMVKVLRLCSDAGLNRAAIDAMSGSDPLICATPDEAAVLGARGDR
jgi:sugar phosphate isomerase/epimerase